MASCRWLCLAGLNVMPSALIQTFRSRWFALCVHLGLWVLLYLVAINVGGHAPDFRDATASSVPAESPAPVAPLGTLFATARWPKAIADTNNLNPFITRYFVPAQPPAPPPPPTTRKIEVTYQGFYQSEDGPPNAVVKIGDAFVTARAGLPIVTNLFVARASMQTLTLTNLASQTNLLQLNVKKEIEVPNK